VNSSQIGVIFNNNLDIELELSFSPTSSSCKRKDISSNTELKSSDLKSFQGYKIKGGKI
jgi:hypothetical protein